MPDANVFSATLSVSVLARTLTLVCLFQQTQLYKYHSRQLQLNFGAS